MRVFHRLILAGLIYFCGGAALADEVSVFSGTAAVMPSGTIMVEGHHVTLWGHEAGGTHEQR